jgi:hypothetical protein
VQTKAECRFVPAFGKNHCKSCCSGRSNVDKESMRVKTEGCSWSQHTGTVRYRIYQLRNSANCTNHLPVRGVYGRRQTHFNKLMPPPPRRRRREVADSSTSTAAAVRLGQAVPCRLCLSSLCRRRLRGTRGAACHGVPPPWAPSATHA